MFVCLDLFQSQVREHHAGETQNQTGSDGTAGAREKGGGVRGHADRRGH